MSRRNRKIAPSKPAGGPRPSWLSTPLVVAVAAALVCSAFVGWWYYHRSAGSRGPIILISIDTLRADHLPIYGYGKVKTPAIDALAADGIVFEQAYAHSPQTLPSHASILTGQLPFETGVRDNIGFTLRGDQDTLASRLKGAGYITGGVVSAFVLRKETGIARGFDFFDGEMPLAAPDMPMGQVQRSGSDSLAIATRWMQGLDTSKFFLFFHVYDPHTPYAPPERFRQYEPYDGEIAYTDEVVGQLVAWLKQRGWYDGATIIFLSDHGEGLGDHGELEHGLFLYDSTIRVPLVVKMPNGAGGGRRVASPAQHIDLVPTVLEWAGVPRPSVLRGRSLQPVLEGTGPLADIAGSYAEAFYGRYHFGWSELYSMTDSRYRFIKAPRPELYDLQGDRSETKNLAAERPAVVSAARAEIERLIAGVKMQAPGQVTKEDLERLQALGYVGTQASVSLESPGESLPDPKDKAPVIEKFRKAIALAASHDFDQSATLMREVLADSPTMKDGWLQLGVTLVRSARFAEALDAFKRLVETDPADANSFVSVAGVLVTLGRLDEARANAEMALSKAGAGDKRARTSACEVLVKAAMAKKDVAAARQAASLSQQADPEYPLPAYVEGLALHGAGDFAHALPYFQDAARRIQGHPFAIPELFFHLGDTFANLGDENEAVAAFREEIRLFPMNTRARMSLAMLYRASGRNREAETEVDAMLKAVPTPEGYAQAVKTWTIFGETARADAVKAAAAQRFDRK
jgi:arylsulfatase A-like enzyme/Flp pilus assembly protein TadD